METNETDNMLKGFFGEQKQEIADNGFSKRVMRKLPEQADRSWIVWVFAIIGMVTSLFLGFYTGLFQNAQFVLPRIPVYYILAGVFCFPLVGTIGFYFTQNKHYRLI
jgi:hypothetical protein